MILVTLITNVPQENLLINEIHNEDEHGIIEEIYELQGDFNYDLIGTHIHVVRCLHTIFRDED